MDTLTRTTYLSTHSPPLPAVRSGASSTQNDNLAGGRGVFAAGLSTFLGAPRSHENGTEEADDRSTSYPLPFVRGRDLVAT